MKKEPKTIPEDIQRLLKSVVDSCEKEDRAVREVQLRSWRRLKLLWEGFTNIWYSEVAHDWRIWDETQDQDTDQAYYDKPINVFRAYLESIIAALSVTVPPIKCFPDDADNPLDMSTAKAGDKISELVYRHNNVSLLWLHALFVYCTEGMTAFYVYPVENIKYGIYEESEYDSSEQERDVSMCSNCGATLGEQVVSPAASQQNELPASPEMQPQIQPGAQKPDDPAEVQEQLETGEMDEFSPDDEDVPLHDAMSQGQELCPACMVMMDPQIERQKFIITRLVGKTTKPKSRICIEAYGGMNVKVPINARNQSECPYLQYAFEINYTIAMDKYKNLRSNENLKLKMNSGSISAGGYDQYDQWARLSPQYMNAFPENVVTEKHTWLRPAAFNFLHEEDSEKLRKRYPDGCKVILVNGEFAKACNEELDDYWTLTYNPMADYLYYNPLGMSLTSVQDITNDIISLVLQTIEHGIGQTFADPAVLNFNAYTQTETLPGGVFPATPKSGKGLGEGFYELKTATLSGEVLPFFNQVQSLGQIVSGALPSLFGGQQTGVGGDTASGYSMSRAQALQRLQNTWKIFTSGWKETFGKVIPAYIKIAVDDEHFVTKTDDGDFINTFIRRAELEGKIGQIELEANESLPMTWSQTKDTIMQLMTNTNPEVMAMMAAPENLSQIHEALGLVDFYVPGEDSVIKQYDEIKELLNSTPIPNPDFGMPDPETGEPNMNEELPSVEIDPLMDNSQVEFEICKKWATSEAGRQAKRDNPDGYRNVLLHAKEHYVTSNEQMMQQQMSQQPPEQEQEQAPKGKGANPKKPDKTKSKEAPITGEGDVQTTH